MSGAGAFLNFPVMISAKSIVKVLAVGVAEGFSFDQSAGHLAAEVTATWSAGIVSKLASTHLLAIIDVPGTVS